MEILTFDHPGGFTKTAAEKITSIALESVQKLGLFTIALSGGNTPKAVFELLTQKPLLSQFPWDKTFFFFGDERMVPHGNPDSNYKTAADSLFSKAPVLPGNIFPMPVNNKDNLYEETLRNFFILRGLFQGGFPVFDLILLGLGKDGHTASLFPGSPALEEKLKWTTASIAPPELAVKERLTLTLPVINHARRVLFLVLGSEKKEIIREVLAGNPAYPASLVQPAGNLIWMVGK